MTFTLRLFIDNRGQFEDDMCQNDCRLWSMTSKKIAIYIYKQQWRILIMLATWGCEMWKVVISIIAQSICKCVK